MCIIDCITWIIHQLLWGYRIEEKLHLGVREQKKVECHWSRRCESLDGSQPDGPPRHVTGTGQLYLFLCCVLGKRCENAGWYQWTLGTAQCWCLGNMYWRIDGLAVMQNLKGDKTCTFLIFKYCAYWTAWKRKFRYVKTINCFLEVSVIPRITWLHIFQKHYRTRGNGWSWNSRAVALTALTWRPASSARSSPVS
jgi:hypothetical protein